MAFTDKSMTQKDADQATKSSYNDVNATIGVDGFLVGKVGRKITQTIVTTTIANDTAVWGFYENSGSTHLYDFTLVYTDGTRAVLISAERTA